MKSTPLPRRAVERSDASGGGPVREKRAGRNLTSSIVHDLGVKIVTGHFDHHPFPFESDLCAQYGVSRPVLREAVKMLTAKGLLAARQRHGTTVLAEEHWNLFDRDVLLWMLERDFSIELLVDFTETRLAVEPRAAGLAALHASGAQRARILDAITMMEAADVFDDDALQADIAFHVAVLEASNNRFFRQFTDLAETTLRFSIRRTNEYQGVKRADAAEHRVVADAIMARDAVLAATEMQSLIQRALNLLITAGRRMSA